MFDVISSLIQNIDVQYTLCNNLLNTLILLFSDLTVKVFLFLFVHRYLARPYLINDSKFDMRVYVYVSSYDPLRLYVFEDGLARFASMK